MKNIKEKGFSLIEILLTLAIIMVITVSSFFIYNKVKDAQNISKVVSQINQIREAARSIYNIENTYVNISAQLLIKLDLIPKEIVNSNNKLTNIYGGDITVRPSPGNNNLRFNIAYYNVPVADCIKIAAIVSSPFFSVGLDAIDGAMKNDRLDIRLTIDGANKLCNVQGQSHVNMLFQSS